MIRRARFVLLGVLAAILAATGVAAASGPAGTPLDIPIPTNPTLQDLLSTSSIGGDAQGLVPGIGACKSAQHRPISLPADDAAHNGTYLEWWWWHGSVIAADGHRYAFTVTFASKPWAHILGADYTLTDLSNGTFHYGREPLLWGPPPALIDGFRLQGQHVSATGGNGHDQLHFDLDGTSLDLSVNATKPPVLLFGDGHAQIYCNAVNTYSRPRMRIAGSITTVGRSVPITGTGNYDHHWGFGPLTELAFWDWFTIGLNDGRDIFLVDALSPRGQPAATLYTGWITDRRGRVTILHRGDFTLTPTRLWHRDATCSYPVEWDVTVKRLHLHVRASLDSTEVRALNAPAAFTVFPTYWDGETVITGPTGKQLGRGWLDTKYCLV